MAITPTNSNTVSIINLPQSQLAVGSDLLVLQTTNGTRTITFDNFNVVKTDISGNATIVGDLTGNKTSFKEVIVNSLTAANISTAAGPSVTLPTGFYNQFTIANGLILSAVSNVVNDPVYLQLYTQDIPNYVNSTIASYGPLSYVNGYGSAVIPAGQTTYPITIDSFFTEAPNNRIGPGSITPAHFTLTTDFIPTTAEIIASVVPSNLTAIAALSALGFNSPPGTNFLSMSGTSAINLLSGGFNVLLSPSYYLNQVNPILTPGSIGVITSSTGINDGLGFEINIGMPQTVPVTVYWRVQVPVPNN
jgi:hypothetical protein